MQFLTSAVFRGVRCLQRPRSSTCCAQVPAAEARTRHGARKIPDSEQFPNQNNEESLVPGYSQPHVTALTDFQPTQVNDAYHARSDKSEKSWASPKNNRYVVCKEGLSAESSVILSSFSAALKG